ncbi:hypothetical protein D3C71_1789160 [compost metagenome]
MPAMRFAGMELGVPPAPTDLCAVRRAAGAPSVRSAATTRQLLCRAGEPMVHCQRRVTPYRLWISPDRAVRATCRRRAFS